MGVLNTHAHTKPKLKEQKKSFGGDGYVYYLDCGDGITGVCICPNSSNCVYQICAGFFRVSVIPQCTCKKKEKDQKIL